MSFINKAFEDEFMKENSEVLKHVIPKLVQIWKQLGLPATKIQERVIAASLHHKERWDSMLEEEQNNKDKIVSTIDSLARQHHQLCEELGTHYREFGEEIPLLEMEKLLQETLIGLNKEKEKRINRSVQALFQEEDVLCKRFHVEHCALNRDRIPSAEQYKMLQQVIAGLKTELETRQEKFVTMRDSIENSMTQLEISPSSFEMNLLLSDLQRVSLSDAYLGKIKDLHLGLISRIERNQSKVTDMWTTIRNLWERLSVEADTQEIFEIQNPGSSPSTVRSLERELARLEELKRQNIERLVHDVRQDLISWWDRCFVSDAERRNFTPFNAEVFTEDLLELHESQVEKYKALHTSNKEIFLKIHHRETLWKRVEDIVANGRDPVRLFNNRGCVLLKEEKKRTKVVKGLPRVEAQITELLNAFELAHGQVLPINGRDYRQVIVERWTVYEEEKENEKAQRQRERAHKLVEEVKSGAKPNTPIYRRFGTTCNARMVPTASPNTMRLTPARSTPKHAIKLPFLQ